MRASKQSKRVDDLWNQLRSPSGARASASAPTNAAAGSGGGDGGGGSGRSAPQASRPAGKVSLTAVCRPVAKPRKGAPDQVSPAAWTSLPLRLWAEVAHKATDVFAEPVLQSWRRQFGLGASKQPTSATQQQVSSCTLGQASQTAATCCSARWGCFVGEEENSTESMATGCKCGSSSSA